MAVLKPEGWINTVPPIDWSRWNVDLGLLRAASQAGARNSLKRHRDEALKALEPKGGDQAVGGEGNG